MVKKGILQNIPFIKINRIIIIIISFLIPSIVKADTINNYYKIEYIKGTGTQWIDTGFIAVGGMKAEYEVEYGSDIITINGGYIVGSHNLRSPYARNGGYYNNHNVIKGWELGYGDYYPKYSTTINYGQKYKVEFQTIVGNAYLKVDNVLLINDDRNTNMTCNTNVMLFTHALANQNNEVKTKAKVYYVKIWDKDGNLVRDYIPVKKKDTEEIGMYDLANNIFYTNAGTGNFEGGNIIPEPEPGGNTKLDEFLNIYIDRINYLGTKTIENEYMFAFVVIIMWFIVLEMTLHIIHIRGGYKK